LVHFGNFWSLFLSGFGQLGTNGAAFLMLLMELYMGMIYLPIREKELGSLGFKVWLLLANVAINSLFLLFTLVLTYSWNAGYQTVGNNGLWPLLILRMSQQSLADPTGSTNFWGLASIPNKWYPLFFVGVFSLFNRMLLLGQLAATALAYLAFFKPELSFERLLPSTATLAQWEKSLARCLPNAVFGGIWLSASGARGVEGPSASTVGRTDGDVESGGGFFGRFRAQARPTTFTAFSGQGQRLGGGGSDPSPTRLGASATTENAASNAQPSTDASKNEEKWQLV